MPAFAPPFDVHAKKGLHFFRTRRAHALVRVSSFAAREQPILFRFVRKGACNSRFFDASTNTLPAAFYKSSDASENACIVAYVESCAEE
jgi:hypothetical protein